MGEGGEIRGADRADRRHDRQQAGIERRDIGVDDGGRDAGSRLRKSHQTGRHGGAHVLVGHRGADADRAREHGLALERGEFALREAGIHAGAKSRRQAIDRCAAGGAALDHGARRREACANLAAECKPGTVAYRRGERFRRDRLRTDLDRRHIRHRAGSRLGYAGRPAATGAG
jgi:hypothetical protein